MNDILHESEYYKTSDLALAGILAFTYPIESIDKQNPRKAQFLFKRDDKLDELVEQFWRGELQVEPASYFNQIKVIKSRLYSDD